MLNQGTGEWRYHVNIPRRTTPVRARDGTADLEREKGLFILFCGYANYIAMRECDVRSWVVG